MAGGLRGAVRRAGEAADCRLRIRSGPMGTVTGRFEGRPGPRGGEFRVEAGLPDGCVGVVRAYLDRGSRERGATAAGMGDVGGRGRGSPFPGPGQRIRARATWRRLPARAWTTPENAGYLILDAPRPLHERGAHGLASRVRGRIQGELDRLYGGEAPVAEALVLARKERLEPEVRDAFARAGVAHLLAISGFHVGILAGILLLLARTAGLGPRRSPLFAAAGAWLYVGLIGWPDAAVRAALVLALLAAGRVRGRPVVPLGALATAFVVLLVVDPTALGRVGFQLSFAGVAGLILWSSRWSGELRVLTRGRAPRFLADGVAASLAAGAATLPLVAWHFGRVPLLGVPATLLLSPVVGLAVPGIVTTLVLDPMWHGGAAFLAGGVGLLLHGTVWVAEAIAALPGAAAWVSRSGVVVGSSAGGAAWILLRLLGGAGRRARRVALASAVVAGLLVAPAVRRVAAGDEVEVVAVDVGQGDAFAVRSPRGRWILVDAGRRSPDYDMGARRVVPFLRREGADRLEALVLTHPDLDHIGGAPAVLRDLEVGGVVDPAWPAGKAPYEEVLRAARERRVGWWPAEDRRVLDLDGMELRVLHPLRRTPPAPGLAANDLSVVLLLRYGRFGALLTGDAPKSVEREVLPAIRGTVQLLKVGHHGSSTSTASALLDALRPEVAVVSVGWRNRYGHPAPGVLARLRAEGARIYRTDLQGTIVVHGRADGSWSVTLPDR